MPCFFWCCAPAYTIYHFDNGDDYYRDGLRRIVDSNGRIGYQDEAGQIAISPRFAFGFPFKNGRARVTDCGRREEVEGSRREHWQWRSDKWYYIDRKGQIVADPQNARP